MRQRKVKHQDARLAAMQEWMLAEAAAWRGRWAELARERSPDFGGELYFEPGCGRGHFLTARATDQPEAFFIGAEGRPAVLLSALERTARLALPNLRYIGSFIDDPTVYFGSAELAGVYVQFCDPWPKTRHAKRRLTHRRYLSAYRELIRSGGAIEFKTDDDALYQFTLDECRAIGLTVTDSAFDLYRSEFPLTPYQTQYEYRFRLLGKPIHYCRIEIS